MPSNVCGIWPAFWTSSDAPFFAEGEIDIIESINQRGYSQETLHTAAGTSADPNGCQVAGNVHTNPASIQQLGDQLTYNCFENATWDMYGNTQYVGQGCTVQDSVANTYGADLNNNAGAVYVMEWTEAAISIWSFPRNNMPSDIALGSPTPSTWPSRGYLPVMTTAKGSCDVPTYFANQRLIFNTDFCGSWADQFWSETSCSATWDSCENYVANNPNAFADAYWLVNSLKVYTMQNVAATSSSSSTTSTT